MNFENLVGNENTKQILNEIIKSQNIAHGYMFCGISGIGKFLFAKEFAKSILCEEKTGCGKCKSCIEFDSSNNPDFQVIMPDENSIKIEQIRLMNNKIWEKPIISNRKVYIINNAELMTEDAQNCLLKTLEEPPEYAVIILISSNENLFLTTIKSRCVKMNFNPISDEDLKNLLIKNGEYETVTDSMLKLFSGSMEKAVNYKGKQDIYSEVEKIIDSIETINLIDLLNSKETLSKNKEEIIDILDYINILLLDKLRYSENKKKYTNAVGVVEETKNRLKRYANFDMTLDYLLLNIYKA